MQLSGEEWTFSSATSINESTCKISSNSFWNYKPFLSWLSSSAFANPLFFLMLCHPGLIHMWVWGGRVHSPPLQCWTEAAWRAEGWGISTHKSGWYLSVEGNAILTPLGLNNPELLDVAIPFVLVGLLARENPSVTSGTLETQRPRF